MASRSRDKLFLLNSDLVGSNLYQTLFLIFSVAFMGGIRF